jgi:NAD(P)-dependent dehydrogenase (short-subunit alcohol dehydrogenase family)
MAAEAKQGPRRALVLGGTGTVGAAVLRGLRAADVPAVFTYHRSADKARALAAELGHEAVAVNLAEPGAIRALAARLDAEDRAPTHLIHCAAVSKSAPLAEITDADWEAVHAVNARSAFVACQALAGPMARRQGGHIVLVGALDRAQSLPLPVHFAASQGMLSAMTMALAKELGPSGILVNMVALGVLEGEGISRQLDPRLHADYRTFSALRRPGTPDEAARAILWVALENSYMTGKVVPVNGGI